MYVLYVTCCGLKYTAVPIVALYLYVLYVTCCGRKYTAVPIVALNFCNSKPLRYKLVGALYDVYAYICWYKNIDIKHKLYIMLVKILYNGHSREPENVPIMSSCPLCTG